MMLRRSGYFGVVVVGTLIAISGNAVARTKTVAVLGLHFVQIVPALRKQVRAKLSQALVAQGYAVLSGKLVRQRLRQTSHLAGCIAGRCLSETGKVLGADRVIYGGVARHGQSYDIVLTLFETRAGALLAQVTAHCDVCTFAETAETVARMALQLEQQAQQRVASFGWLKIRTDPIGAEVELDGASEGATPLELLVSPGRHEVVIRHAKAAGARRLGVNIEPGATTLVSEALGSPSPVTPPPRAAVAASKPTARSWLPWLMLGSGASVTAAGAVLMAMHDDCLDAPACAKGRATRIPGIVLVAGGAAALVTSALLFWRDQRPRGVATPQGTITLLPGRHALSAVYTLPIN